jgi:hypothetical protein
MYTRTGRRFSSCRIWGKALARSRDHPAPRDSETRSSDIVVVRHWKKTRPSVKIKQRLESRRSWKVHARVFQTEELIPVSASCDTMSRTPGAHSLIYWEVECADESSAFNPNQASFPSAAQIVKNAFP